MTKEGEFVALYAGHNALHNDTPHLHPESKHSQTCFYG